MRGRDWALAISIWVAPLVSQAQVGTVTYADGRVEEDAVLTLTALAEPQQRLFIKQDGKWKTILPAELDGLVVGIDTFKTVRLNGGPPALLKQIVAGPLLLYVAEESFLHGYLVQHHGESPLDPLATNAERVFVKADTNYGNQVPILAWPDGTCLVLNTADKTTLSQKISSFLDPYTEPLPSPPARARRVPLDYFVTLVKYYNNWSIRREKEEGEKNKDKF